ncbi:hypothetical protein ELI15_14265 [Rhizobium ruizarguesonis]|uniref:hypothetical protein n=1 Tax=Rhizobium ruizarguesonis TaxID=2081791 RepID=UPI0010306286|nr:hypothetical protein [Rhizobium ruizarguesonis]TAW65454.1 hypothetical protein ELI15_14265 [Rhizobium ruizarguesonis]
MNGVIEREYIRFQRIAGSDQLIEHRFRSTMEWPKTGKFYALATDAEAVERCKRFALRTPEERAAEKAEADARHERYRVKQTAMPVLQIEEPTPSTPPPVRRFTVPTPRRRPPMPAPRR